MLHAVWHPQWRVRINLGPLVLMTPRVPVRHQVLERVAFGAKATVDDRALHGGCARAHDVNVIDYEASRAQQIAL